MLLLQLEVKSDDKGNSFPITIGSTWNPYYCELLTFSTRLYTLFVRCFVRRLITIINDLTWFIFFPSSLWTATSINWETLKTESWIHEKFLFWRGTGKLRCVLGSLYSWLRRLNEDSKCQFFLMKLLRRLRKTISKKEGMMSYLG